MKQVRQTKEKNETLQMLDKMKTELRPDVLNDIETKGMEQKIFNEYHELAIVTRKLLAMLHENNFTETLNDENRKKYDLLMLGLSKCGVRCQILLEESSSRDFASYLEKAPVDSKRLN